MWNEAACMSCYRPQCGKHKRCTATRQVRARSALFRSLFVRVQVHMPCRQCIVEKVFELLVCIFREGEESRLAQHKCPAWSARLPKWGEETHAALPAPACPVSACKAFACRHTYQQQQPGEERGERGERGSEKPVPPAAAAACEPCHRP